SVLATPSATTAGTTSTRVRVGVVGAGLIAQVMHLHYLRELGDRFEVVALCDIAPENATASAERFGITRTCSDWRQLLRDPYVAHYPLAPVARPDEEVLARLTTEAAESIGAAIGDADESLRRTYRFVLLDTLVHELNATRGVLGEPDRLDYVDLRDDSVTVMLR